MTDNDKVQCSRQLSGILAEENRHAQSLIALLREEQDSIHQDADKLLQLSIQKQQLTDALESLHRRKAGLITQLGYADTRAGITSCLQWCDPGRQLERQWQQLLQLLRRCQEMNAMNGMVIEGTHKTVRQALAILYGQPQGNHAYSAAGKKTEDGLSRSIGKA